MDDFTIDSIYREDIRIKQPRRGYRFALDALLLAHFLKLQPEERALEVGCGSGVVLVLLAKLRESYGWLTGVEIQPELAELAKENLETNSIPRGEIIEGDIRHVAEQKPAHSYDLVYSNPPYRRKGAGRLNPDAQKAIARHELQMTLHDLFAAARKLLRPQGRLSVILPGFRESDFLRLAASFHMQILEWQYVHSFAHEPPALFLATVSRRNQERQDYPRLVIYDAPGKYTAEMERVLFG